MKKINIAITGGLGKMGQKIINSSKCYLNVNAQQKQLVIKILITTLRGNIG